MDYQIMLSENISGQSLLCLKFQYTGGERHVYVSIPNPSELPIAELMQDADNEALIQTGITNKIADIENPVIIENF